MRTTISTPSSSISGATTAETGTPTTSSLSDLLFRAAPRPTLLLTVTEYRPQWSEVNEVIRELASFYDNVTIVDWEQIARAPGVLSRDGLHPGGQGEAVLVEQIAVALGELDGDDGECLSSRYTDDSSGRRPRWVARTLAVARFHFGRFVLGRFVVGRLLLGRFVRWVLVLVGWFVLGRFVVGWFVVGIERWNDRRDDHRGRRHR